MFNEAFVRAVLPCLALLYLAVQVESEVEHDTRIRRSYRNMRGQHNVDCWQWLGPRSASLETIGVSLGICLQLQEAIMQITAGADLTFREPIPAF